MQIVQLILSVFSIATIFCLFFRPKIGVATYMIYMFLAPHLIIGGKILGTRTESLILLVTLFLTFYRKTPKKEFKPLKPFLVFYGLQLLLIPFSFDIAYSFELWMLDSSKLIFYAFLVCAIFMDKRNGNSSLYTKVLIGISLLVVAYGLFLTSIPGLNPYQMVLQPIFGGEFDEVYAAGNGGLTANAALSDSRIFGRISSFFSDPQEYALALGFMLFLFVCCFTNRKLQILLSIIVLVAIVTCGVRTPIAAIVFTLFFIMVCNRQYQLFLYLFVAFAFVITVMPLLSPELFEYVISIVSSGDDSSFQGSSLEMRLRQLEGCMSIMSDSPFFGNGIGWTGWYLDKYDGHPQALYFESILFSVMCNMGLCGFVLWGVLGFMYYGTIKKNITDKNYRTLLYALFIYYITYTGITGDYGYLYLFVIFFIVLYNHCVKKSQNGSSMPALHTVKDTHNNECVA